MAMRVAGVLAGVAVVADGARVTRRSAGAQEGKTLAGVPVLNYDLAYGGRARASAEQKEHWMVVANEGVESKLLAQLCESSGACEMMGEPSEGGVPFFEVYATEDRLTKVLSQAPKELAFVEPDGRYQLPEDTVEEQTEIWGLAKVGVPEADKTGKGVHIYVLDTGLRTTHQDFGGRAFAAVDFSSGSRVICSGGDAACAADGEGHGTHCSGTAAGTTFGVAPGAKVYGAKVFTDEGAGDWSWSIGALDYLGARVDGPRVASMSLGGRGVLRSMEVAVNAATNAGVVVVVAAGNDQGEACFFTPAFVATAVTVGSTTSTDFRSSFSNYGSCTKIWAPGSRIESAAITSDTASVTESGTSMACPHVSGAAALLLEEDPSYTPARVSSLLQTRGVAGGVTGLLRSDNNYLLWVGAGPAPPVGSPCRRRLLCSA